MAYPRLQCLNASRHVVKKIHVSRAVFSTSQAVRADEQPPRNTTSILLSALDEPSSPSFPSRNSSPNSFNLPTANRPLTRTRTLPVLKATGTGPTKAVLGLMQKNQRERAINARNRQPGPGEISPSTSDRLKNSTLAENLSRQITRRWKQGDVYAPHDLSSLEMAKWKRRSRPVHDAFDVLDFKPQDSYSNFKIMSEYMTEMGRIKHSKVTGLRPVNQRRIARAVRRSIGMGLMPSVHHHPEILRLKGIKNQQITPIRTGSPQ